MPHPLTVYASLASGYSGTLRGAPALPGDAMEPDEPQTGWGATSAAAGLKTRGAGSITWHPPRWCTYRFAPPWELTPPLLPVGFGPVSLGLGCFVVCAAMDVI